MRKNKMMRAASGLLVAVLLTTCVISGTFAKYVTTNSGEDSARVAKFGVTIDVSDDMGLFKTTYAKDDTDAKSADTVVSASTDRKIAPGTKGSMQFSITGTPEVATKLDVTVDKVSAVQLAAGNYELAAGKFANKNCAVTIQDVYEPIKWYVGTDTISDATKYDKTLAEVESYLENLAGEKAPKTELNQTYYIGWKWDFDPTQDVDGTWKYGTGNDAPYTGAKIVNFLDTYLGDEANLQTESFDLKISVTQVD